MNPYMDRNAFNIAPGCPRDEDGQLTEYAWPGAYTVYYVYVDGGVCCADCARGYERDFAESIGRDRVEWGGPIWETALYSARERIGGWASPGNTEDYPTEEEGDLRCDNCHAVIAEVMT